MIILTQSIYVCFTHIYIYTHTYIYVQFQRANLACPIPSTSLGLEPLPLHVASGLWLALSATEDLHFSEPSVDVGETNAAEGWKI